MGAEFKSKLRGAWIAGCFYSRAISIPFARPPMHSTATADSTMPPTRPAKATKDAQAAATLADPRWAAV